ncbi:MAG TPA: hypothetical protein VNJ51_12770 [Candidatus Dormibacteraeota bacterium]|nr:hypothetical protein [Candidatus Dormibacteraeota bacterium]
MIELRDARRSRSASHLHEICREMGVASIVDPYMGLPTHLNYLKRHGIAVHGGDPIEWFAHVGQGIVVNDSVILRDFEIGEIVETAPGRIYPPDLFRAWEGVFFTEEQCRYLAAWHENVKSLRSDGQVGLAILGLWWAFAYWLQKLAAPDDLLDVPPSELAYAYIRKTERWVGDNARHNTVRHAPPAVTMSRVSTDAVLLTPPAPGDDGRSDARTLMWEAWWQGNPYQPVERLRAGGSGDASAWQAEFAELLAGARKFPLAIVPTSDGERERVASALSDFRSSIEERRFSDDEIYLLAR